MGLSDCSKCWNVTCSCGYQYRNFSKQELIDFICGIYRYNQNLTHDDMDEIFENVGLIIRSSPFASSCLDEMLKG